MGNLSRAETAKILLLVVVILMGIGLSVLYHYQASEHARIAKEGIIEKLYPIKQLELVQLSIEVDELTGFANLCYEELNAGIHLTDSMYCELYNGKVKQLYQSYIMLTTDQLSMWAEDEGTRAMAKTVISKVGDLSRMQSMILMVIYIQSD